MSEKSEAGDKVESRKLGTFGSMKSNGNKGLLHRLLVVSYETLMHILFALPRFGVFNVMKSTFLRLRGASIGKRVTFYPGVWISPGSRLTIGDDVDLALGVIINSAGGVFIGDRTLIGYRSCILSSNHTIPLGQGRIFSAGASHEAVIIENDVWIASHCIILPGVTIGEGAVIAAGSVVTKSVPPFTIVAGIPARPIRSR